MAAPRKDCWEKGFRRYDKFIADEIGTMLARGDQEIPVASIKKAMYEHYGVSFQ